MKIVFMGTPDIAAACLQEILKEGHHTVCAVYTRADKPVGRKQVLTAPPVKQLAVAHGIPVFQPVTLRDTQTLETIRALAPDIIVVVAYGRILPKELLGFPPHGAVNLHVSLLPKYRGAAPVQWSVIHGDTQTGVTIMQLDEGLDTGDILKVAPVEIGENTTSGELFEQVTAVGAQTLCRALDEIEAGNITARPQDHSKATQAPPLDKTMAMMDFARPAKELHNLVRGCNPWPVAYFTSQGKKVKVLRSLYRSDVQGEPGKILCLKPLTVACGNGALELVEVVPEGSRPMPGDAWAAGRRFHTGDGVE